MSNTALLHVLRCAAENAVNHGVERCGTPARYADTPGGDPIGFLRGYVGDGVASNDVAIDIEHDVPSYPHPLIVERAQNRCPYPAQHRPHDLRIHNGSKQPSHRRLVTEPRDRDKDFVFTHARDLYRE
jgi:hypothetical protein